MNDGQSNHGFLWILNPEQKYRSVFAASSDYSDPAKRPKLVVTYQPMKKYFYLKDHLGNIRVTVDENGDVKGYNDYYPFGLRMPGRSMNNALATDMYKYSSKELDEENGINWYYFGARYYDPMIGRWWSVDPLADKYISLSPYNYVENNPLNLFDPNGLDTYLIIYGAPYLNYTMAGDHGDVGDNFRLAAETQAEEIKNSDNFNSETDEVIIVEARSTEQFTAATNADYESGKIVELTVFSHGYIGGISLGGENGNKEQLSDYDKREINSNTMSQIDKKNFTNNAQVNLNGCNIGQFFAQKLANYLGIRVSAFLGPTEFKTTSTGGTIVVPTNPRKGKKTFEPKSNEED